MGRIIDLEEDTPVKVKDCHVEEASYKALLITFPDKKKRWVPRSQITEDSEVYEDFNEASHGTLVVKRWWAKTVCILHLEA